MVEEKCFLILLLCNTDYLYVVCYIFILHVLSLLPTKLEDLGLGLKFKNGAHSSSCITEFPFNLVV